MLSAYMIKYEQKNVTNILRRRGMPSRVASLRGQIFGAPRREGCYEINSKLRKMGKKNKKVKHIDYNAVGYGSSSAGYGIMFLRK